jgi:signal recognition particle GTPase
MALALKLRLEDALHDFPEAAKGQAIEKKPKPGRKALAKSALIVQPMNNQQNTQLSLIHQERPVRVVRGVATQPSAAPLLQSLPNLANP